MWGGQPWDNDTAADWFANLMDTTQLPDKVRATLRLAEHEDAAYGEYTAELRAAVYCVLHFCRVYVWPIDHLDADLDLAIAATRTILADEEYCDSEEITAQVQADLDELVRRRGA
jgi:hypothetical protein